MKLKITDIYSGKSWQFEGSHEQILAKMSPRFDHFMVDAPSFSDVLKKIGRNQSFIVNVEQ